MHIEPLDSLLLQLDDEGRLVATSSTPSSSVYGITPESAMVNAIFHNPDCWDAHFDDLEEGDIDYAGPDSDLDDFLYYGPRSGVTMNSANHGSTRGERKVPRSPTSPLSDESSTKGYSHNKRHLEDPHFEGLTLKSFESRHRVIPCLSPASSRAESPSSPDSSTLSSDSYTLGRTNWKGIKDNAADHNDINLLPLLALFEPSNNRFSNPGGKRLSLLWSHQNIFRALPSLVEGDDEFDYDPDNHIPNFVSSRGVHHLLTTAFSHFEEEEDVEDPGRVELPATSTAPTTITTMTTNTISSPDVSSSSPGVTFVSASATWSVLELYGDSPPLSPVVPKMTGHFTLKPSDLVFSSSSSSSSLTPIHLPPPPPPPHSKRLVSELQQLRIKPKLKGPRLASGGSGGRRIASLPLLAKSNVPTPTPIPKSISWHAGKIRPLPKPPHSESPSGSSLWTGTEDDSTSLHPTPPPSEGDELSTLSRAKSLPMNIEQTSSRPVLYSPTSPPPIYSKTDLTSKVLHHKGNSESSSSPSQIRSRFPLPPPRPPLDIPLPPLPETADVDVDVMTSQKAPALVLQATNQDGSNPAGPSSGTGTGSKAIRVPPLSSSILQRLHTLELSAAGSSKLPSPTSRHKPSASESSLMFPTKGKLLSAKDTMSTLTPPLYKTRFAPDVPLPDASTLAKRTRKIVKPTVAVPSDRL